jgi:hypothetical protein
MPVIAPAAVRPGHQMPSSSIGQNVEAATANASSTECATASPVESTVRASVASAPNAAEIRKAATPLKRRPSTSWPITPAMESTSPEEVERNAAKAPAASTAVSRSATVPCMTWPGRSSTAVSLGSPAEMTLR